MSLSIPHPHARTNSCHRYDISSFSFTPAVSICTPTHPHTQHANTPLHSQHWWPPGPQCHNGPSQPPHINANEFSKLTFLFSLHCNMPSSYPQPFNSTVCPCKKALNDIDFKANEINEVILVGGMVHMPKVDESIFGRGPIKVARGLPACKCHRCFLPHHDGCKHFQYVFPFFSFASTLEVLVWTISTIITVMMSPLVPVLWCQCAH